MRAQRRLFPRAGGADVACELGARVDGVRRQRVGVFVSAGEAVGGAGGVGVSVLILSVFSSRSTVSGGFVALFALFLAFSIFLSEGRTSKHHCSRISHSICQHRSQKSMK